MTPFGTDAVAVQAFPSVLKDTDVTAFLRDLLDKLTDRTGETGADVVLNDMISMMACKAAVKAGDPLTQEEIDALMKQRDLIDKSASCPHGSAPSRSARAKRASRRGSCGRPTAGSASWSTWGSTT